MFAYIPPKPNLQKKPNKAVVPANLAPACESQAQHAQSTVFEEELRRRPKRILFASFFYRQQSKRNLSRDCWHGSSTQKTAQDRARWDIWSNLGAYLTPPLAGQSQSRVRLRLDRQETDSSVNIFHRSSTAAASVEEINFPTLPPELWDLVLFFAMRWKPWHEIVRIMLVCR